MMPRSVQRVPVPLQVAQAPSELALKSAGLTPSALANALRIGSSNVVYVAGLLRRDPRIGLWSMEMALWPGGMDRMRELFPAPATSVMAVRTPSGMSTSTSRRLCCWRRGSAVRRWVCGQRA
jgi:hypothetical protein